MKRNSIWYRASVLGLCVLLSGSMLFARLYGYAAEDHRHYIPLTRSAGSTVVRASDRLYVPGRSPLLTASWFRVKDSTGKVWKGETKVEIFKLSYKNKDGQVTVKSANSEKVVAPGTSNTYTFSLENTGAQPVKYEMHMKAWFNDSELYIPVVAKVTNDYKKTYLCGTKDTMADVMDVNKVKDSGTIAVKKVIPYTLTWEWPFEGDDEFDTMLGNLSSDEELTLTIAIYTTASYTPASGDGLPKTGDESHIQLMFGVMLASAAGLMWMFLIYRREEKENEAS